MLNKFIILFYFIIIGNIKAQSVSFKREYPFPGQEYAGGIVEVKGGFLMCGSSNSFTAFPYDQGPFTGFFYKVNKQGVPIWFKYQFTTDSIWFNYDGLDNNTGSLRKFTEDTLYALGSYGYKNWARVFLTKLDTNGNVIWEYRDTSHRGLQSHLNFVVHPNGSVSTLSKHDGGKIGSRNCFAVTHISRYGKKIWSNLYCFDDAGYLGIRSLVADNTGNTVLSVEKSIDREFKDSFYLYFINSNGVAIEKRLIGTQKDFIDPNFRLPQLSFDGFKPFGNDFVLNALSSDGKQQLIYKFKSNFDFDTLIKVFANDWDFSKFGYGGFKFYPPQINYLFFGREIIQKDTIFGYHTYDTNFKYLYTIKEKVCYAKPKNYGDGYCSRYKQMTEDGGLMFFSECLHSSNQFNISDINLAKFDSIGDCVSDFATADSGSFIIYPNPLTYQTKISCELPFGKTYLKIVLYNASGQVVKNIFDKQIEYGTGHFELPFDIHLNAGVYFVRVTMNNLVKVKKLLVLAE